MSENMKVYDQVRKVPDTALKPIVGGRLKGFSDINPMWRIKTLTEVFGVCGFGWKTVITDRRLERGHGDEVVCFVDIHLFVNMDGKWSEPIEGTGGSSFITKETRGLHTSDECFKMAYTDALGVACKSLGVAADVYYEKDRTKYNQQEEREQLKSDIPPEALKAKYKLGKGSMEGFDDWVKKQQEKGRNFRDMEHILQEGINQKPKESA
jgi:hypothetical protein